MGHGGVFPPIFNTGTYRAAIAPLPGLIGWISSVQAYPEVPIVAATRQRLFIHTN